MVSALFSVRVLGIGDPARFRKSPIFFGNPFMFFGILDPLKYLGFRAWGVLGLCLLLGLGLGLLLGPGLSL